ncbi:MFS transporter [Micromonospora sp. NPDC023956]|uniref:MFS transporter n=1 Tax=Micromonospora sp. NPDC023956 TaxID=3155722 RepID=UPI0033E54B86
MSDTAKQTTGTGPRQPDAAGPRRPGLVLTLLAACALMIVLDSTVVYVALPKIQQNLEMTGTGLVWVVNAYALAFGGLMLLGGRAGDIVGQRRVLLVGLVVFGVASLLCGLAASPEMLIAARALQGVGAALVAPTSLSLIPINFTDSAARNKAIGVYTGIAAAGGTLGLILGGVLSDVASWRWVFFINVPVVLLVVLLAPGAIRESQPQRGSFDIVGAVTSTGAMVALVYALVRTSTEGWDDVVVLACLAVAAVLFTVLILAERRAQQPLLPLRLFTDRVRASGFVTLLFFPAAFAGMFFFLTQYFQGVWSYSALRTGFAFIPAAVLVLVAAVLSGQLVPKLGASLVAGIGAALTTLGMVWLTQISADGGYVTSLLGPLAIAGFGAGLIYSSVTASIMSNVAPEVTGAASSVLQAVQQIGPALGLAVLVTAAGTPADPVEGMRRAFWVAALIAALPALLALFGRRSRTS